MTTFMTEMPQKRTVVFTHFNTGRFPIDDICFTGIECNDAISMSCQHRVLWFRHEKIKTESVAIIIVIFGPWHNIQALH